MRYIGITRILFIVGGIFFVVLGVVGIVLPVLPTTPFLLLAAFLFLKSSEGLYQWLTENPILGVYIKVYIECRSVTLASKIISISLLWAVMGSTVIFFIDILWLRILLLAIALGVTIHLLLIKTLSKEDLIELKKSFKNKGKRS